jgi:diadenosine tetraphosphate (Ap4A) HIT family hydrolase
MSAMVCFRMSRFLLIAAMVAGAHANVVTCTCDPSKPETLEARQCGLCREAEKHTDAVFFLKDINPTKPNRWLALPRTHEHSLAVMPESARTALWTAAAAKGKELFGDEWALAVNGPLVVTQCHTHIHIGKLLQGVENDQFITVQNLSEIPAPAKYGMWVHPQGHEYHVHTGEQITETVLLR